MDLLCFMCAHPCVSFWDMKMGIWVPVLIRKCKQCLNDVKVLKFLRQARILNINKLKLILTKEKKTHLFICLFLDASGCVWLSENESFFWQHISKLIYFDINLLVYSFIVIFFFNISAKNTISGVGTSMSNEFLKFSVRTIAFFSTAWSFFYHYFFPFSY